MYSPLSVLTLSSDSTATPCFLAKPRAAGVGAPAALKAAPTGGPLMVGLVEILLALGHPSDAGGQAARRGEALHRHVGDEAHVLETVRELLRQLLGQAWQPCSWEFLDADLEQEFTIHDVPAGWSPALLLLSDSRPPACLGDGADGHLPHAQDVGHALGHVADAAGGVEQIEHVRALQAVVERRQHEAQIAAASATAGNTSRRDRDATR